MAMVSWDGIPCNMAASLLLKIGIHTDYAVERMPGEGHVERSLLS